MSQRFSKRELAAIAIATAIFIGASAFTHLIMGGFIAAHLPHGAAPAPEQSPIVGTIEHLPSPTPAPTPKRTTTPAIEHTSPPSNVRAPRLPSKHDRQSKHSPASVHPVGKETAEPIDVPTTSPLSTASPDADASPMATTAPNLSEARFKTRVSPSYPSICLEDGAAGTAIIDVTIGPDGSVVAATVGQTSGYACLDEAALGAAKESTYWPPEQDGRPITQTYAIIYEFSTDS